MMPAHALVAQVDRAPASEAGGTGSSPVEGASRLRASGPSGLTSRSPKPVASQTAARSTGYGHRGATDGGKSRRLSGACDQDSQEETRRRGRFQGDEAPVLLRKTERPSQTQAAGSRAQTPQGHAPCAAPKQLTCRPRFVDNPAIHFT